MRVYSILIILIGLILISGCKTKIEENQDNFEELFKDLEFYGKGLSSKDLRLCNEIKDLGRKWDCYWLIGTGTNNVSVCERMEGVDNAVRGKRSCYYFIALNTNNYSLCEKTFKFSNACYWFIAVRTRNLQLCNKVNGTKFFESRENCQREIKKT